MKSETHSFVDNLPPLPSPWSLCGFSLYPQCSNPDPCSETVDVAIKKKIPLHTWNNLGCEFWKFLLKSMCVKYNIYRKECIKWIENKVNSCHSNQGKEHCEILHGPFPEPAPARWWGTHFFSAPWPIPVCVLRAWRFPLPDSEHHRNGSHSISSGTCFFRDPSIILHVAIAHFLARAFHCENHRITSVLCVCRHVLLWTMLLEASLSWSPVIWG